MCPRYRGVYTRSILLLLLSPALHDLGEQLSFSAVMHGGDEGDEISVPVLTAVVHPKFVEYHHDIGTMHVVLRYS